VSPHILYVIVSLHLFLVEGGVVLLNGMHISKLSVELSLHRSLCDVNVGKSSTFSAVKK
jgi:hypothetical protein